ncbi:hypothetical protein NHJ13051_002941 [Beauveria bassiana]
MSPRQPHSRRCPSIVAATLLASYVMIAPISGHALPRQTVRPTRTMDILSWPIEPTLPAQLARRDFNTICGYIGGNPDLPATCMAGSHCVVDAQNKAIGCCPDKGDCTKGIFTDCIDENKPGHGVVDPHIYSCGVGNFCYKNTFEGGYFQYGCGSASDMATTVVLTASGEAPIAITTVSVSLRPTTTLTSVTSSVGNSPSSTSGRNSEPTDDSTNEEGEVNNKSAIVGGVVGGLAAITILLALGIFLWRRNRTPESPHRPLASPENDLDSNDDLTDTRPAPKPPGSEPQHQDAESWPIPPTAKGGIIGGAKTDTDTDQTPLTHKSPLAPTNNIENFSPVDTGSMPRRGGERPFWQQTGGGRTRNFARS